ncbi:class I SAM-dependent methyltransferase [Brevundimonas sp.]|uniref:class I SAM-dependent methyltransferase n=1 Tax=Brevundimonas sp. TaxID=1871086 RepID=UPI0028A12074|nr:class I SAM-dependent methyltransferase [Brevundimonas sp.]
MTCAIKDPSLFIPLIEDGHPTGRTYNGNFHPAKRCACCGYVRFETPSAEDLDQFYNHEYPQVSASWYNVDTDYAPWKTEVRSSRVIDILNTYGIERGASVHEFGCAFGGTVHALNQKGYDASGTELNREAVEKGRARGNDKIFAQSALDYLDSLPAKPKAIYSYHALEHFTDPFAFLRDLRERLDPNGIIISFLPNSAALFALVYGYTRYVWFNYPEHIHMFSPGSANALTEVTGFDLLSVFTSEFGIEPEATARATETGSAASNLLKSQPRQNFGEELVIVMTPRGSALTTQHKARHREAQLLSLQQSFVETDALDLMAGELSNPWP